ncbi:hypothetical protein BDAP_000648 [Binucleata daphniae]
MPFNDKKRKVSFSTTPQVKFLDHASSSKTVSSISIADELLESTLDYTNAIDEHKNESETIDLGSVINTINNNVKENKIQTLNNDAEINNKSYNNLHSDKDIEDCNETANHKEEDKSNIINNDDILYEKQKNLSTTTLNLEYEQTTQNERIHEINHNYKQDMSETIDLFNDVDIENELFDKNDNFDKEILNIDEKQKEEEINKEQRDADNVSTNVDSIYTNTITNINDANNKDTNSNKYISIPEAKDNTTVIKTPANNNNNDVLDDINNINKNNILTNNYNNMPIANNSIPKDNNTTADNNMFYTTKDLKTIFPSQKVNIMQVLEKHRIKFVDKNTIQKRKTISRQNEVKPQLIYYYKYFAYEFYEHFNKFINILDNEIQKKQENIARLENESYAISNINFNGIKKNCRMFAMNEWYLKRIERENEFNARLQENRNKINEKLKINDYKEDFNKVRAINEELERKIEDVKQRKNKKYKNNINDFGTGNISVANDIAAGNISATNNTATYKFDAYKNNIKNYFKKNTIFSESFVNENLSYKNLMENKMEDFLVKEIKNRKEKEKEKRTKKEKLENEIKEINKKIEKCKINKNIGIKEMENEKKKMDLYLKMNKLRIGKISKDEIRFEMGGVGITIKDVDKNGMCTEKREAGGYAVCDEKGNNAICNEKGNNAICNETGGNAACDAKGSNIIYNNEHDNVKLNKKSNTCKNNENISVALTNLSFTFDKPCLKDFYNFEMQQIKKSSLKEIIYFINEMNLLCKEIKNKEFEYENNCFSIKKGNKSIRFNMNEIEICEDDVVVYKGKREYGMIQI